jgi:hypothetical protein
MRNIETHPTPPSPLDPLVAAIAEAVVEKLERSRTDIRLLDVKAAAKYIGRTPYAIRYLLATKAIPSVRHDGRLYLDRLDLDRWIDMGKS